jgi:signal transduction histidine kinase/DNA-binding response OmpR family regulator/methyl-accepting chemotaxis protein
MSKNPPSDDQPAAHRTSSASLHRILVTWFTLVALLSGGSVGMVTFILESRAMRDRSSDQLKALRDEKVDSASQWIAEREADVELAARRDVYVQFSMDQREGTPDLEKTIAALNRLRDAHGYHAVFLASTEGQITATTESEDVTTRNLPVRREYLERAINTKRTLASDVLISKVHLQPTLFVVSPILSPETSEVIGAIAVMADLEQALYPRFTESAHLGRTGEILLVSEAAIAQSPLKYRDDAVARAKIKATPAQRAAEGQSGHVDSIDYRGEPVSAAYGFVPVLNWGLVVKQDLDEIEAPIETLAKKLILVVLSAMAIAVLFGFFIARSITSPAMRIAAAAAEIGKGHMSIRAETQGPAEIRLLAESLNRMVDMLGRQYWVSQATADLYSIAGKHTRIDDLLAAVLPKLAEVMRSQAAVVYLHAESEDGTLEQVMAIGLDSTRLPDLIHLSPPDHLLALAAVNGAVELMQDIPATNDLVISTHAGDSTPQALLIIPLRQRGRVIGVLGLASMYDFEEQMVLLADVLGANLGQSIEVALASERSERMGRQIEDRNIALGTANAQLENRSAELEEQTRALKDLAQELEGQRQQLAQADRLKSEFLSNMSHELRTPLNSIMALSQLMIDRGTGKDRDQDARHLEVIARNGGLLLSLINEILDLAKIESGTVDIRLAEFSPRLAVIAVAETIRPLATEKGLTLTIAESSNLPKMYSDQDKLRQILLNLVSNAVKFTNTGSVTIDFATTDETISFIVRDTGVGIALKDRQRIFEEFRQVDGSTTRRHGGTGLGLTIVLRLTELLGGSVTLDSEPGEGSEFVVTLPLRSTQGRAIDPTPLGSSSSKPAVQRRLSVAGERCKILVIEDNDIARQQIESVLASAEFEVTVARSGEEALELARNEPDGIVLDLMMPGMDGFQVLNRLRATAANQNTPVLILTAKELTPAERDELHHNSIAELVQKGSLNRQALLHAVKNAFGMQTATPDAEPEPANQPPQARPRGPLEILVVEDNADNRSVITAILADLADKLTFAMDGISAVEMTRSQRPTLVLMDIQLPGQSGLEATQQIKADPALRGIPIVAVTAKAMKGDREEALAAGCDEYVTKPIDPSALIAIVRKLTK